MYFLRNDRFKWILLLLIYLSLSLRNCQAFQYNYNNNHNYNNNNYNNNNNDDEGTDESFNSNYDENLDGKWRRASDFKQSQNFQSYLNSYLNNNNNYQNINNQNNMNTNNNNNNGVDEDYSQVNSGYDDDILMNSNRNYRNSFDTTTINDSNNNSNYKNIPDTNINNNDYNTKINEQDRLYNNNNNDDNKKNDVDNPNKPNTNDNNDNNINNDDYDNNNNNNDNNNDNNNNNNNNYNNNINELQSLAGNSDDRSSLNDIDSFVNEPINAHKLSKPQKRPMEYCCLNGKENLGQFDGPFSLYSKGSPSTSTSSNSFIHNDKRQSLLANSKPFELNNNNDEMKLNGKVDNLKGSLPLNMLAEQVKYFNKLYPPKYNYNPNNYRSIDELSEYRNFRPYSTDKQEGNFFDQSVNGKLVNSNSYRNFDQNQIVSYPALTSNINSNLNNPNFLSNFDSQRHDVRFRGNNEAAEVVAFGPSIYPSVHGAHNFDLNLNPSYNYQQNESPINLNTDQSYYPTPQNLEENFNPNLDLKFNPNRLSELQVDDMPILSSSFDSSGPFHDANANLAANSFEGEPLTPSDSGLDDESDDVMVNFRPNLDSHVKQRSLLSDSFKPNPMSFRSNINNYNDGYKSETKSNYYRNFNDDAYDNTDSFSDSLSSYDARYNPPHRPDRYVQNYPHFRSRTSRLSAKKRAIEKKLKDTAKLKDVRRQQTKDIFSFNAASVKDAEEPMFSITDDKMTNEGNKKFNYLKQGNVDPLRKPQMNENSEQSLDNIDNPDDSQDTTKDELNSFINNIKNINADQSHSNDNNNYNRLKLNFDGKQTPYSENNVESLKQFIGKNKKNPSFVSNAKHLVGASPLQKGKQSLSQSSAPFLMANRNMKDLNLHERTINTRYGPIKMSITLLTNGNVNEEGVLPSMEKLHESSSQLTRLYEANQVALSRIYEQLFANLNSNESSKSMNPLFASVNPYKNQHQFNPNIDYRDIKPIASLETLKNDPLKKPVKRIFLIEAKNKQKNNEERRFVGDSKAKRNMNEKEAVDDIEGDRIFGISPGDSFGYLNSLQPGLLELNQGVKKEKM